MPRNGIRGCADERGARNSLPRCCTLIACVLLLCSVGCNTFQPHGFPREIGGAAQQAALAITDQAKFDEVLARLRGQMITPGLRGYVGVMYVFGGELTGVSGQLSLEGDGTGSGELSDAARARLVELSKDDPDALQLLIKLAKESATQPPSGPPVPGE